VLGAREREIDERERPIAGGKPAMDDLWAMLDGSSRRAGCDRICRTREKRSARLLQMTR
jgi:hypothetical protein